MTDAYLEAIPERARIRKRLMELWSHERYRGLVQEGGRYFYLRNDGLQNQSVLYTAKSSIRQVLAGCDISHPPLPREDDPRVWHYK